MFCGTMSSYQSAVISETVKCKPLMVSNLTRVTNAIANSFTGSLWLQQLNNSYSAVLQSLVSPQSSYAAILYAALCALPTHLSV